MIDRHASLINYNPVISQRQSNYYRYITTVISQHPSNYHNKFIYDALVHSSWNILLWNKHNYYHMQNTIVITNVATCWRHGLAANLRYDACAWLALRICDVTVSNMPNPIRYLTLMMQKKWRKISETLDFTLNIHHKNNCTIHHMHTISL